MNKAPVYITLLLLFPLLLSSCFLMKKKGRKHKKQVSTAIHPTDTLNTTSVVITDANQAFINSIAPVWKQRIDYKTFAGKAKISLEGPDKSADFSANFRIAKDSLIWMHISALGGLYSVARILIRPDSFFMLDYTNKEVTMLPIAAAGKVLPAAVGFSQLQNLITGDPLSEGTVTYAEANADSWSVNVEDTSYIQQLVYKTADSTMSSLNLQTRKPGGPHALINYTNYEKVTNRILSLGRIIKVQNGLDNYSLDMNIVNPEFDKELEFPFSIPKSYSISQ